jgi:hypothetical protein
MTRDGKHAAVFHLWHHTVSLRPLLSYHLTNSHTRTSIMMTCGPRHTNTLDVFPSFHLLFSGFYGPHGLTDELNKRIFLFIYYNRSRHNLSLLTLLYSPLCGSGLITMTHGYPYLRTPPRMVGPLPSLSIHTHFPFVFLWIPLSLHYALHHVVLN